MFPKTACTDESWVDSKRLRPEKTNQSEDFPRNSKNRKMTGNTRNEIVQGPWAHVWTFSENDIHVIGKPNEDT